MIAREVRRSKRYRICETRFHECIRHISPGQRYLNLAASPYHDNLENPKWWHLSECEPCARSRGYGEMFDND